MPTVLSDRAEDNLRFIRDTMAHAGAFTSVSGTGTIGAGVVGIAASVVASPTLLAAQPGRFLSVWMAAAFLAGAIAVTGMRRKARRAGQSLVGAPARRFTLAFFPAIAAGAMLTVAFAAAGQASLLPGTWLSIYGAAVTAGGAFSVRPVPVMGCAFLVLGAICFALPAQLQQFVLAAGFGGLHLAFGYHITRHYGG
jgi:phosphatidylglycerophosphate synthase